MTQKKYNGWTNYETWAVNEDSSYGYWTERARELKGKDDAITVLASELQDSFQEAIPEQVDGTVYRDLLDAALERVNWREIAKWLLE